MLERQPLCELKLDLKGFRVPAVILYLKLMIKTTIKK